MAKSTKKNLDNPCALLEHLHLLVRAEVKVPIKKPSEAETFLREIIEAIDIKILYGPIAQYSPKTGNRGITAFAVIETSHVAMHIWDEIDPALVQLDVYSCANFDKNKVFSKLETLKPSKIDYKYLDRKQSFIPLAQSDR